MPNRIRTLYGATWLFTLLIALVDWGWAARIGFRLGPNDIEYTIVAVTGILVAASAFRGVSRLASNEASGRRGFYLDVSHVFAWIALLCAFSRAALVLQYLTVTTDFPTIDAPLVSFDAIFDFRWLDVYRWVKLHRWLDSVLGIAYASGMTQLFTIPFILTVARRPEDYVEFVLQFVISGTLVVLIALPFPANSAYVHFGISDADTASSVSHFALLRSHQMHELLMRYAQGLVSLPSFHTVLALCFAYSLRHVRYAFAPAIALNVLMILSTPTHGGHYFADVLAGAALGVVTIVGVRRAMWRPIGSRDVAASLGTGRTA